MAQSTCWYAESRKVFENRLTTTAFAKGNCTTSSTTHSEMNELFVDPRPPCNQ